MMKYILFVLFLSISVTAQEKEDKIVAKAGGIEITASEFEHRFNLNPQPGIHRKAQGEANKKIFLYGLIAEKLLSQEALQNRYDTSETVKYFLKNFEKMFVRDELYAKEVKEKSAAYAGEILSFYLKLPVRISARLVKSDDRSDIDGMYHLLNTGFNFDDLYNDLPAKKKDTATIYSGTFDNRTENELFSLPEQGYSKPIWFRDNWVIFCVDKKSDPVIARSMGWEAEYKRLEKLSREQAEGVFYNRFMSRFFTGRKAEASGYLISSLAHKINKLVGSSGLKDTSSLFISSADLVKMTREYSADTLDAVFARLEEGTVTFKEFLYWLRTESLELKKKNPESIAALLNARAKRFVEFELLAGEGYRQGLDKSENVRRSFAMWRDNYLYQLRMAALSDSLWPAEQNVYVTVIEIINEDPSVMEKALDELAAGNDFLKVAVKYSAQKPDARSRPLSSLGELRDAVMHAETGKIYGPVNTNRGFIIFRVTEKKNNGRSLAGLQGENQGKVKNPFGTYTAGLANKYGVEINEKALEEIKPSNINAMVFRYLGFGGKISAVPVIIPLADWVSEWNKEVPPNP